MILLQATKGPRGALQKIPKHVALAFGRRTLSKCRKFGKSGVSCFSMPPLRDILFAPPENELETLTSVSIGVANTTTKYIGFQNPHPDSRISSGRPISLCYFMSLNEFIFIWQLSWSLITKSTHIVSQFY